MWSGDTAPTVQLALSRPTGFLGSRGKRMERNLIGGTGLCLLFQWQLSWAHTVQTRGSDFRERVLQTSAHQQLIAQHLGHITPPAPFAPCNNTFLEKQVQQKSHQENILCLMRFFVTEWNCISFIKLWPSGYISFDLASLVGDVGRTRFVRFSFCSLWDVFENFAIFVKCRSWRNFV